MDRHTLVKAAARRARVRTRLGVEGVLVYAPGTKASIADEDQPPPRHGDRTMCGVRIDGQPRDNLYPIPPEDIVEIL